MLVWGLATLSLVLATALYFVGRYALRGRARRKGRRLIDIHPVRPTGVPDIDPVFATTPYGPSHASESLLVGAFGTTSTTSLDEAWILAGLAKSARTIFEFGTCSGRTTYILARSAPDDAVIGTLTLAPAGVDAYQEDPGDPDSAKWRTIAEAESAYSSFYYTGTEVESKIRQYFGDSKSFNEDEWLSRCDLIFIDGSHAYSYVKNDSEMALRMLKPNGVIVWHDFSPLCPGVWSYLGKLGRKLPIRHLAPTRLAIYRSPGDSAVTSSNA